MCDDLSEVNAVVTDIERDLADLSKSVAELQEENVTYDGVSTVVSDAVDESLDARLASVLEYAYLRMTDQTSAVELLALLREGVRYG